MNKIDVDDLLAVGDFFHQDFKITLGGATRPKDEIVLRTCQGFVTVKKGMEDIIKKEHNADLHPLGWSCEPYPIL